ncbi:serine hydrolase domain-containing protein [Amycolatopsis lurida]
MLRESGLRRMRDVLGGHVASGTAPGLVALVGDGTRTHVETFGSVERDTIFRLASLSKPLTAAATMILVEECRSRLDDPVDEWLPELANRRVLTRIDAPLDETVPARRAITVRDLLTQTPGFGLVLAAPGTYPIQTALHELSVTSDGTSAWPTLDQDEWLKRLGSVPLMYQPGERWQYHISSDVLGVLISRVAGQSFEAFLQERLCAPLGMKDTGFSVPAGQLHRLPASYAHDPSGALTVWDSAADGKYSRPPSFQAGGDGLVSTVDDYNAFFRDAAGLDSAFPRLDGPDDDGPPDAVAEGGKGPVRRPLRAARGLRVRHGGADAPAGPGAHRPIRLGRGPGDHGLCRSVGLPRDPAFAGSARLAVDHRPAPRLLDLRLSGGRVGLS